jgi:ribosome maturation factor RimP
MLLSHPNQLTPQSHAEVLSRLRERASDFSSIGKLVVRDWDFTSVEGAPTVQVFLDKGLKHPVTGRMEGLLLDECAALHRFLMESDAFASFADELSFEVGSAGINPRLREPVDFEIMVGCWVSVETWERIENRRKYVMILDGMENQGSEPALRLREGESRFLVPVSMVRRAEALLDRGVAGEKSKPTKGRAKKG